MYSQHVISHLRGKSNQNVIYIKCGIVHSYIPGSSIQTFTRSIITVQFCIISHFHTCIFTTRLLSNLTRSQLDDDIIHPKKSSSITIPILRSTFYLRVKSNQNVYIRCDHGIVYSYNPGSRAFRVQTYTRSNIAVRFCITSHMYFHVYIPHDCISMCLCNEIFIGANMQDQGSGVLCVVAAPFKMVITQCKPPKPLQPQSTACRLHLALTRQRIIESP